MLNAQTARQYVTEYVKLNNLQNPTNPRQVPFKAATFTTKIIVSID